MRLPRELSYLVYILFLWGWSPPRGFLESLRPANREDDQGIPLIIFKDLLVLSLADYSSHTIVTLPWKKGPNPADRLADELLYSPGVAGFQGLIMRSKRLWNVGVILPITR